ncbi:MAG TPA: carboxypeptidase-like regulatory domain-containing protein, partial [Chitinophagaceae bacterium]|nr:carboxypeptidase-like regulatory domain-containing protein [Chitinophagaceae bacterium]
MRSVFIGLLLMVACECTGQDRYINGIITNSLKQPIQGVTVTLRLTDSSKILAFAITGSNGNFRIGPVITSKEKIVIEFRHLGYDQKKTLIDGFHTPDLENLRIELVEKPVELKEVVIKRELPVVIRSDTIVFNANSYRDPEVRKVEDLLRKMQGFSVDASGKLSFNGKPVEKVLIDGDDLAAEGYQMITKNLNAITIDKVEVVNNFSDNRLMRKVVDSDKVGVNLKISSRFKSKLSGSAEGGLAWEGRFNADANLIYLTRGPKWLVFGNFNNIARDVSGNAKYYYQQEGGQLNADERAPGGGIVLEEGEVVMPAIGDRYTRDNKDLGLAIMNSWKIGKHTRLNGMFAMDDLNQVNQASNSVLTRISELEQWFVLNQMHVHANSRDLVGRLSLHRDAGKKQVTRFDVVVKAGNQNNAFSSNSYGDIEDSLNEKLNNNIKELRFKGQQTWMLRDKVLQASLIIDHGRTGQDLSINTARFLSYWQLDSSYILNHQMLGKVKNHQQLHIKVNGKTQRLQYEYGLLSDRGTTSFSTNSEIGSVAFKPSFEPNGQLRAIENLSVKGAFRLVYDTDGNGWFALSGSTGLESILEARSKTSLFAYETGLGYSRKFGL